MQKNKIKEFFRSKNSIAILVLTGLLFLVISIPTGKHAGKSASAGTGAGTDTEGGGSESDYARRMEVKLKNILEETEGTGKVSVMITLKSSEESIVEKDQTKNVSSSAGENDRQKESDNSEATVFEENSDGTQSPYVSKKITPEIDGIIVVADGAGDAAVVENITEAVKALFDVDMHKIKVIKRKAS